MRILIVTDAWPPQVNGVVRTLQTVGRNLAGRGHEVKFISPEGRRVWPLPTYPEIELSLVGANTLGREIEAFQPDAIHIATEGPLGWAARRACLRRKLPFTTSFHTRFAEYFAARTGLPIVESMAWKWLRHFHKHAHAVMAPSLSTTRLLESKGFKNVKTWTRGVDPLVFHPRPRDYFDLPRPIYLHSGRVVLEKNIEAFLKLDLPGTKVVVGDGPERAAMQKLYPTAVFTGYLHQEKYTHAVSSADALVFPSLTDTFGLVMIEAMACGTPVAGLAGSTADDVVEEGVTGSVDANLALAVARAAKLDRQTVYEASKVFNWDRVTSMFESWLVKINWPARATVPQPAVGLVQTP